MRKSGLTMLLLPYKMGKRAEMIIRKYQGGAKNSPQMPIDIKAK